LSDILACDLVEDQLTERLKTDFRRPGASRTHYEQIQNQTVGAVRDYLLGMENPDYVLAWGRAMTSEMIAAVAKVMTNDQLRTTCATLHNPLQGEGSVGSATVFGSRIQPNSPTDAATEILYSIFEGLSYGCGDVIIGINPANDSPDQVIELENLLHDVVKRLNLPTRWSVLSDIKKQHTALNQGAEVDVAFQSLAGTSEAIFGMLACDVDELLALTEPFNGLYFETGQGSEFTNGAASGVDMVTLEARTYGLARLIRNRNDKWTIVNDVAGFIGPEVFKTADQLIRACLEDLFMGKMHGLAMGLDVCSTYHMGIAPAELDLIMKRILPAGPGYLMAVAGKSDPMLGYLTTDFRSHPRLRRLSGKTVTHPMQRRLRDLGIMHPEGTLTGRAGDLYSVAREYGIDATAIPKTVRRLQARGMDIGHGCTADLRPPAHMQVRLERIFRHARRSLYRRIDPATMAISAKPITVRTTAAGREEYIAHPPCGERIEPKHALRLRQLYHNQPPRVLIAISDGLNADAVNENLPLLLPMLKHRLSDIGLVTDQDKFRDIYIENGRVRAGYHIGQLTGARILVHLIGERPGTGTNNLSTYITYGHTADGHPRWETVAHAHTTALCSINREVGVDPGRAARQITLLVAAMMRHRCSGVELAPFLAEPEISL